MYICDNNLVGHINTYIPFDDNFLYSYILDKLKNIYSYHENGTNYIYILKDLKQNYSYNISKDDMLVQQHDLSTDKKNIKNKIDNYYKNKQKIIHDSIDKKR